MKLTEIKKELYKQKPTADFNFEVDGYKRYTTQLQLNGKTEVIFFYIPLKECDFEEIVTAQLLIRWIV